MAQAEADEIAARARRMRAEMKPASEIGAILIDRMAMLSVRLERCERDERERLAAMNDGDGGLVDLSREGQFAFRYEQAAQRNFHKAHDEFRRVEAQAKAEGIVTPLPARPHPTPAASPCLQAQALETSPVGSSCAEPMMQVFGLEPQRDHTRNGRPNPPKFTPGFIPIAAAAGPDPDR